jgi:hypothetical protein
MNAEEDGGRDPEPEVEAEAGAGTEEGTRKREGRDYVAGSNEPERARTKEDWGTLAEAGQENEMNWQGQGQGKSNQLAGAKNRGLR